MQLDENRIVIRERSYLEILDLSLRVIRSCAVRLVAALAIGVVPAMLLNAWLTAGAVGSGPEEDAPAGYLYGMFLLVLLEAPLATAPMTLFLGQSLFSDDFRERNWPAISPARCLSC
jgi:hypothetical protein